MPRGSLHFNIPEEQEEFEASVYGMDYRCALSEFSEWIFFHLGKHEWPEGVDEKTIEFVREKFKEITDDLKI